MGQLLQKFKKVVPSITKNFIIVKLDIVAHYLNIPHETGPQLLEDALGKSKDKHIPTNKIENMAEFVFNEKCR